MEVGGCCMCNLVQFVRFNPALWTGVGVRNVAQSGTEIVYNTRETVVSVRGASITER